MNPLLNVPTRDQVSPANQALFDNLKKGLGMVPNLYATLAHSEHALGNYLAMPPTRKSNHRAHRRRGDAAFVMLRPGGVRGARPAAPAF